MLVRYKIRLVLGTLDVIVEYVHQTYSKLLCGRFIVGIIVVAVRRVFTCIHRCSILQQS